MEHPAPVHCSILHLLPGGSSMGQVQLRHFLAERE